EAREQQQYIKEYGPDLFTGDGMESQQFLKDLGKRNERSGWTKAMETKAEGLAKFMGGTSRETIVKEFTQQALGRAEQIRKFANEHSEQMYNTTGHKIKSINKYLHFRLGIIHISADRCL